MSTGAWTPTVIALLVISLLLLVFAWLMPALGRPTLQFGVRVPTEHADDPVIITARRGYRRWIAVAGGAVEVCGVVLAGALGRSPLWTGIVGAGAFGAVFLVFVTGYARARHLVLATKQRETWYAGRRQGVAVDTSLHTAPEPFPWLWTLPALLVLGATLVIGIARYSTMPALLATHYRAGGTGQHLVPKSVGVAFMPVFTQIVVTTLIVVLMMVVFRSRPDIDAAAPVTTARRHRIFLARMARALLVLAAFVNVSMAVAAWNIWTGHTDQTGLVLAPAVVGIATVLIVAVRTGQEGSRVPVTTPGEPAATLTQRDDDALWRGGLVYVNQDDPAVFVPKRFGIGWTINLGNRLVWVLAVATAGFVVAVWTLTA